MRMHARADWRESYPIPIPPTVLGKHWYRQAMTGGTAPTAQRKTKRHLRRSRARMHAKTARQDDPPVGSCYPAEIRFRQRRYRVRRPVSGLFFSFSPRPAHSVGDLDAWLLQPLPARRSNTLGHLLLITSLRPSGKQDDVIGGEPRPGQPGPRHHGKCQFRYLTGMRYHIRPARSEVGSVGSIA